MGAFLYEDLAGRGKVYFTLTLVLEKKPQNKNKTGGHEQTKGGRKGRWDENV